MYQPGGANLDPLDLLLDLLALEHDEAVARARAEREGLSLRELEAKGVVVSHLRATDEALGLGGRILVTLERPQQAPWLTPFQNGDLVELLPERPGAADATAPVTAVVNRATPRQLQLAFDRAPPPFVSDAPLRLERVPNDVTFERARAAVQRWKAIDRGPLLARKEVLLGQRPARFLPREADSLRTTHLNPEQLEAVQRALSAEDLFLVHGPPGTGKSTVLAELADAAVARGERLLVTAASNAAVDHLLELCLERGLRAIRVGHPARVATHLQAHTLDLVVEEHPDRVLARELFDEAFELLGYARRQRTRGRSRERFANARASSAEAKRLFGEARALERKAVRAILDRAQVVCATLASLDGSVLANESFDCALLDEATQAIEPLSLIAFHRAPRVILAGDHRQLPPTVLSPEAAKRGLSKSLFERVLENHGDAIRKMLEEQYRMNEAIMRFPSRELYDDKLRAFPGAARRTLTELLPDAPAELVVPLQFLDTAGKGFEEEREEGSGSFRNRGEAEALIRWARRLVDAGLEPQNLAVIAPYSAQATLLRELCVDAGLAATEVDTIDAFQGREKEAVLLSLTRSNGEGAVGFLSDIRRMNVALTRAKRHLFAVGDSATLAAHPFYARFIEHAQATGAYRSAWEAGWLDS